MKKTQQLNKLFDDWSSSSSENTYSFVRDGIINEEKFEKQHNKVLFLCKEPNQTFATEENKASKIWDFREWWKENLWGGFSLCLSTWAHGLINDFPEYDSITDDGRIEAAQSIAFMNVKKTGGEALAIWG